MTPSQYIRSKGLPSLVYVAGKAGKDPRTLYKWFNDFYNLFRLVVLGAVLDALLPKAYGVWRCDDRDAVLVINKDGIQLVTGTDAHIARVLLYERENDE